MHIIGKVAIFAAMLAPAAAATAATYNWTQSVRGPNVYGTDSEDSVFFTTPQAAKATGALNTTISWVYGRYKNGSTGQKVKICWADRYSNTYTKCLDVSAAPSGTTNFFSGTSAAGNFKITFTLTGGGTYPTTGNFENSILVNYTT